MRAEELRQGLGSRKESIAAYGTVIAALGYPSKLMRRLNRVWVAREKLSARHEGWLRSGVHPLGTRARVAADRARHARDNRDRRRIQALLASIDAAYDAAPDSSR